jgi:ribosomal protein S18 acetylase RimI-like enzyme
VKIRGGRVEWERMANAVLDVRLLEPSEWRLLRDVRLRALSDSRNSFISCLGHESRLSDDHWRQRLRAAAWVVAREHSDVVGIAGLTGDHSEKPDHMESIWVDPTHRERGVFRSLLARVAQIAHDAELTELWLWVLEDNSLAWHVYVRSGFVWTGERKLIDAANERFECRMRLVI